MNPQAILATIFSDNNARVIADVITEDGIDSYLRLSQIEKKVVKNIVQSIYSENLSTKEMLYAEIRKLVSLRIVGDYGRMIKIKRLKDFLQKKRVSTLDYLLSLGVSYDRASSLLKTIQQNDARIISTNTQTSAGLNSILVRKDGIRINAKISFDLDALLTESRAIGIASKFDINGIFVLQPILPIESEFVYDEDLKLATLVTHHIEDTLKIKESKNFENYKKSVKDYYERKDKIVEKFKKTNPNLYSRTIFGDNIISTLIYNIALFHTIMKPNQQEFQKSNRLVIPSQELIERAKKTNQRREFQFLLDFQNRYDEEVSILEDIEVPKIISVLHGDYNSDNNFINPHDSSITMLDFGSSHTGFVVEDLGKLLIRNIEEWALVYVFFRKDISNELDIESDHIDGAKFGGFVQQMKFINLYRSLSAGLTYSNPRKVRLAISLIDRILNN